MDFYRKYELIEALPGEGTKSFRAKQVSTARDVTVHLLVGGRTPENEGLLARLRSMPAQSFAKLIEVGDNDGTPYVVTIAPPYQPLAEWLVEQERSAAQAAGKLTQGGSWKMPNAAPTGASPMSQNPAPLAPPVAPAVQRPPVTERPMGATDAFGAPAKPAAPASAPGEFTLMFQAGQKEAASPQRPVGATDAHNVPAAKVPAPPSAPADTGPGEFTRMFQAGSQAPPPAPSSQRPSVASGSFTTPVTTPPVTRPSAPAAPEPGEFTRLFQTGSQSPQQPATPPRPMSTTDSFNAPIAKAPTLPVKPATPPSAPAEPGEFTQLFQTGSATPAQQPVSPQRPVGATDSFNAPVVKAPTVQTRSASPPSAPAEPAPGEFTRLFQTGSATPAQQPVSPQRPVGATDSFNTPVGKAPNPAQAPPSSEFSKMFADAPKSHMPEPSLAPPPPASSAPGEFTKMFNSPLPERPDPKEQWSQPPGKLSEAGTFQRMLPAQPASSPRSDEAQGGEFTRFFKTPPPAGGAAGQPQAGSGFGPSAGSGFGPPAGSGFGAPNPMASMNPMGPAPAQPAGSSSRGPGDFTRMFGKPGQDPAAESHPHSGGHPPSGATGAFATPAVQPAGFQGAGSYGAPSPGTPPVPTVTPPPAEPQGPSEYTMMINRGAAGQPGGAPGAPAGAPAASQSGGGGSPMQINVQAPYIPGIQAPRVDLPYVPQPRVDIAGVRVDGPYIPQPRVPQPYLPQPSIPNASITTKGPSNNTLLIVIFVLVALLIGAAIGVFLKK